jgi:hypothetical protein
MSDAIALIAAGESHDFVLTELLSRPTVSDRGDHGETYAELTLAKAVDWVESNHASVRVVKAVEDQAGAEIIMQVLDGLHKGRRVRRRFENSGLELWESLAKRFGRWVLRHPSRLCGREFSIGIYGEPDGLLRTANQVDW